MYCRNCGVELNPNWNVCPNCGTRFQNAPLQSVKKDQVLLRTTGGALPKRFVFSKYLAYFETTFFH